MKRYIKRICSTEELTIDEIETLDKWLKDGSNREDIDNYLAIIWEDSASPDELQLQLTYENLISEMHKRLQSN